MKLAKFKFELPQELVAMYPTKDRDGAKMLVLHKDTGKIEHRMFKDIFDYFEEGDVLVGNDTKVFPARLYGNKEKTGAKIEVFMLRELNRESLLWDVLVDPARKIRIGNKLYFGEHDELVAEVIDNTTSRGRTLRFLWDDTHEAFKKTLAELGETPLPKYIKREPEESDIERYQTIYASKEGAVAAPTAGLHFSREVLKRFELIGVDLTHITLHVGLGTFRQVEVEDLTKHKMDSELAIITRETADVVNRAKNSNKKVCAIGTTVVRAMESSVSTTNNLNPYEGWTNKFIFPPYEFNVPDMLLTNLHMPQSTLIMMVSAFGGYDNVMKAYKEAIKKKYRFYSYGDAMLII